MCIYDSMIGTVDHPSTYIAHTISPEIEGSASMCSAPCENAHCGKKSMNEIRADAFAHIRRHLAAAPRQVKPFAKPDTLNNSVVFALGDKFNEDTNHAKKRNVLREKERVVRN